VSALLLLTAGCAGEDGNQGPSSPARLQQAVKYLHTYWATEVSPSEQGQACAEWAAAPEATVASFRAGMAGTELGQIVTEEVAAGFFADVCP